MTILEFPCFNESPCLCMVNTTWVIRFWSNFLFPLFWLSRIHFVACNTPIACSFSFLTHMQDINSFPPRFVLISMWPHFSRYLWIIIFLTPNCYLSNPFHAAFGGCSSMTVSNFTHHMWINCWIILAIICHEYKIIIAIICKKKCYILFSIQFWIWI